MILKRILWKIIFNDLMIVPDSCNLLPDFVFIFYDIINLDFNLVLLKFRLNGVVFVIIIKWVSLLTLALTCVTVLNILPVF